MVVIFMIGGLLAIAIGWLLRWRWIREPRWRTIHLGIMVYIAFNAIRGELCFLTHWEQDLRDRAGQEAEEQISFIGRIFRDALYVEVPPETLHVFYLIFGALVLLSVFVVRPQFRRRRQELA